MEYIFLIISLVVTYRKFVKNMLTEKLSPTLGIVMISTIYMYLDFGALLCLQENPHFKI